MKSKEELKLKKKKAKKFQLCEIYRQKSHLELKKTANNLIGVKIYVDLKNQLLNNKTL